MADDKQELTIIHPIQSSASSAIIGITSKVTLRAYEVYRELHGEQRALIENGCRGGFSVGELVAFLYARSFPKSEWRERADEAFNGMKKGRVW